MKKKQAQIQLTDDKDDKDPFYKKQQKATSNETFKVKDIGSRIRLGERLATTLALKVANAEAKRVEKNLGLG